MRGGGRRRRHRRRRHRVGAARPRGRRRAAGPRRGVGRHDRAGGGQRPVLRQGGRPRARAHARRPRRLRRARGAPRRAGAHPPQGRARSSIAPSETWADEAERVERLRAAGVQGACSTSTTCARWSPSSPASWPAPRSSRPTCSARRAPSPERSPAALPRVHTGVEVHGDRGRARPGDRRCARATACWRATRPSSPPGRGAARWPRRPGVALPLEPRKGQLVRLAAAHARRALHPPQGRRGGLSGLGGERRRGPAGHHACSRRRGRATCSWAPAASAAASTSPSTTR